VERLEPREAGGDGCRDGSGGEGEEAARRGGPRGGDGAGGEEERERGRHRHGRG
jgi:hypothetical protein